MVNHIKRTERNKDGFSRFLYMRKDGMPVKCRVTPCTISSVLICTPGWGETLN